MKKPNVAMEDAARADSEGQLNASFAEWRRMACDRAELGKPNRRARIEESFAINENQMSQTAVH